MNVISGEKKNCVILVRGRNHLDGLVDERKIMRVTGCPLISAHKESIYRVMVNKVRCHQLIWSKSLLLLSVQLYNTKEVGPEIRFFAIEY